MVNPNARPIMIALILVTTSLAGCLGDDSTLEEGTESLGTVYTSTWHVQDLVQNIAGDKVDVQLLAPSNIPVHDYEPTSTDLLYLRDADLFFYHGLGLETWVNTTLEAMGDDAPEFVSPLHALVDLNNTFYRDIHVNDVDSEEVTLELSGDAPAWLSLDGFTLTGEPENNGIYMLPMTLDSKA